MEWNILTLLILTFYAIAGVPWAQASMSSSFCSTGELLNGSSGFFSSPNFQNNYSQYSRCTWNITVPSGYIIKVSFLHFQLGNRSGGAQLTITNVPFGTITLNGFSLPDPVYSVGNSIQVIFISYANQSAGFNASYTAITYKSLCPNLISLNETSGVITSPYYPRGYEDNQTCIWQITAKKGNYIVLIIERLDIQWCGACSCDYLEIPNGLSSDGVSRARRCGSLYNVIYHVYQDMLKVQFVSDRSGRYRGFKATYTQVNYTSIPATCISGELLNGSSGFFSSPNFPNNYTQYSRCTWNITVPSGYIIKVSFLHFKLGYSRSGGAQLTITNVPFGPITLYGYSLHNPVYSVGNFTQVTFISRANQYSGFNASYTAINYKSVCPDLMILNNTSGVITSPFYPRLYPNNQVCSWQITASKGKRIKLVILEIYIDPFSQQTCMCDYLEVQNGSFSSDGVPVGRMCGILMGSVTLYSFHETLKVLFVSCRWGFLGYGFRATYTQLNDTGSSECSNYRFLNESNRARTYSGITNLCDTALLGWYRFSGEAGSQMAESCVDSGHCGTDAPGWLNGSHPAVADGAVQRRVCFNNYNNCCHYSTYISVRNCGKFYVYKLDRSPRCSSRYCGNGLPLAPECSNYKSLNESNRARTFYNRSQNVCDRTLSGWYRFSGGAGNQMAESCVDWGHCGTHRPGWLYGSHPAVDDGAVQRKVCFGYYRRCCFFFTYISVRNCGAFFVYKLKPVTRCWLRYCGNGFVPPTPVTPAKTLPPTTEKATKPTTPKTSPPITKTTIKHTTHRIITEEVTITEEDHVILNCTMEHFDGRHVWSREDGTPALTTTRVLTEDTQLEIKQASIADTGVFVCKNGQFITHRFIVLVEVLVKVQMIVKVLNYEYTPELKNKSSEIYKATERNFTSEMDKVYNNTPGYVRTEVLNFTKGSVNVDFRVIITITASDPKNATTIPDTKAETAHRVVVEAKDGFVKQLKVDPNVEVFSPPLEPKDVEIFGIKSDELSVRWKPPADSDAFKVLKYYVQYKEFTAGVYINVSFPATQGKNTYSYRIQDLEAETTYLVRAGAGNKYGTNFNEAEGHKTDPAPFATWIIVLIVLAILLVLGIIVGLIVCKRRRSEQRRRALEEEEDNRFGGLIGDVRMNPVSHYEDKNVKGLKYSYTNESFRPSEVNWKEIPYEKLTLMNELGSGAFGVVYKGELKRENGDVTPCAVKSLKASATSEEIRDLYNELEIMTNVGYHPNLVNLLGACTQDGHLLVVLEIAENGSLLEFLKKSRETNQNYENINSGGLTEEMKLKIATDVAKGMSHLANCRCIHRDLAARNVLLGENYVAKVSDYGMARDVYEQLMYKKETQGKLPVKWMAIESLETYIFTVESDVWSYGVFLWEIESAGLKPYAGMNTTELITELKKGYRLEKPAGCSDAMYQIMRDCWSPNPKARPTFDELVARLENMAVTS